MQHYIPGGTPDIPAATIEKMMADHCPLGRCALPEDVARVVAFLASGDGGWVNGTLRHFLECFQSLTMFYRPGHHHLRWFIPVERLHRIRWGICIRRRNTMREFG